MRIAFFMLECKIEVKTMRQLFEETFINDKPIKAVFSAKRRKSLEYNKVTIRPVMAGGEIRYQAEYTYDKKVTHSNIAQADSVEFCMELMNEFKQVNIFTNEHDIQVLASKVEKPHISRKKATLSCQNFVHNRTKQYVIPDGVPCDFLIRLGVMDKAGKVIPKHYSKFRQINRYLEIVEDVFPYLPEYADGRPLKIIDFGCGKAYLTFAIYYYLKVLKQRNVEIIGLDLKTDVIDFCNKVAHDLKYHELKFLMGDIADYTSDHLHPQAFATTCSIKV